MSQLLRLFVQIALLRRGPQDVPASQLLLALTVAGYFLVNFAVTSILPFPGPWLGQLCVDVVFMFVWYALLLNLVRRPERFLQTTTAVYGCQVVLSPLLDAASWFMLRVEQDSAWQFPATLVSLGLFVWIVTANSHIVKAALEWTTPPSTVLVILQTTGSYLLAQALFPIPTS